tara:strand:- start:456 stop:680 length:225 start_codon:yes stop_codon:yes gene_type:complete
MIYVYVIILSLMKDGVQHFSVHTPNAVYRTEEACEAFRLVNMNFLLKGRPNATARELSKCVSMPFTLHKDKGNL